MLRNKFFIIRAPRFKITYDGKDEITIPCNAEILNIMI